MAGVEQASEGLNTWQTLAGAAAIFLTTAAGVLARFVAKRSESEVAGDSGKHVVLQQASIADTAPFTAMGADLHAIRLLMEEQVQLAEERREQDKENAIKERLDKADEDRAALMHMIEEMRAGREPKLPPRR